MHDGGKILDDEKIGMKLFYAIATSLGIGMATFFLLMIFTTLYTNWK
jgi:hypothetical protein